MRETERVNIMFVFEEKEEHNKYEIKKTTWFISLEIIL